MKAADIEINPDWKATLRAGAKGMRQAAKSDRVQQFTFSDVSPELVFSEISPKRWAVLEAMSGAGEMCLRELARRLERNVKSVHPHVHVLLETGLLEKTGSGKIVCPFDKVRVDFTLAQAASKNLSGLLMVSPMCYCKTPILLFDTAVLTQIGLFLAKTGAYVDAYMNNLNLTATSKKFAAVSGA